MQAGFLDEEGIRAQLLVAESDYLALRHDVKRFCAELYTQQLKMIELNSIDAELTLKLQMLDTQARRLQFELSALARSAEELMDAAPAYCESSSLLSAHRVDSAHHILQQRQRLAMDKITIALRDNQLAYHATHEALLKVQIEKASYHLKEAVKERNARLLALQTLAHKIADLKLQQQGKVSTTAPASALILHVDGTSQCPVCEAIADRGKEA